MVIATFLWTAVVLLLLAAVGGVTMAAIRVGKGINPPAWLAMAHGLLAAAALTLLIYAAATLGLPRLAWWGLVLLATAALAGLYLNLGYQEKRVLLPTAIVYLHAAIAVIGLVLLVVAALA